MADLSPTVRQRELGLRLRELRTAKNLTVEMVAKELLCSPTKISRAETGVRRATLRDVRDLCRIYEVDPETSAELMELARDAYKPVWWAKYDDLKIAPFIGMEQSATAITSFGMYFLPALLQVEGYTRAIIKGIAPKIGGSKLTDLVYVETLVSHLYFERPDEVDRYSEALDYLRDAALNPRDTAKKIEEIRDEY
jgi:transcriptional regulator with XRE-family HTH domain